jgi:hypothetical protein
MQPLQKKIRMKINKIRANICSRLYIDHNSDLRSSVFLAGNARSGTTWISDIINYRNEYRYMFEPFHPFKVDICKIFRYRQYLRPNNKDEELLKAAQFILSGLIKNSWIDSRNRKIFSKKRLIKDVRANLMLKWMHTNFSGMPMVLLFRHPCAIASSWIKLNWRAGLDHFLLQEDLMEDHLNPFRKEIEKADTPFEKNIFSWCIQYYVPLRQFMKGEIYLAFYEKFCENPNHEAMRLLSYLGEKPDDIAFANLRRPSSESRQESSIISGGSLVDSWRSHITKNQLLRAVEILKLFGLDNIYTDESMPHVDSTCHFDFALRRHG